MAGLLGGALAGLGAGMEHSAAQEQSYLGREHLMKMEEQMREQAARRAAALRWAELGAQIGARDRETSARIAASEGETRARIAASDRRLEQQNKEFQARYGQENKKLQLEIDKLNKSGQADKATQLMRNIDALVADGIAPTKAEAFKMLQKKPAAAKNTLDEHLKMATSAYSATLGKLGQGSPEAEDKFVRNYLKEYFGETLPNAPAPSAPGTISTLPPGSKQIGTSKGKAVYQAPDGQKFIEQ